MPRAFFVWIYTTRAWRWLSRVETCSPAPHYTLYIFSAYYCCIWSSPHYIVPTLRDGTPQV